MLSTRILLPALALVALPALSQDAPAPARDSTPPVLDTVQVTARPSGPALWKVSNGDRVLWILGAIEPLPKKMPWPSQAVEAAIASSQEVLGPSQAEIGINQFLWNLPAFLRARKLPDGQRLGDVLPADLYARWSVLKTQYAGSNTRIERRRPRFAAKELYESAVERLGMTLDHDTWKTVRKIARKHRVPITTNDFTIVIDDPHDDLVTEFNNAPVEVDLPCLEATMERIETDAHGMQLRAEAWSVGDIDWIRRLPHVDQDAACRAAYSNLPGMREPQHERETRLLNDWINAAQTALGKNRSTFALRPVSDLLNPDGVLALLRAKGYIVEEPR